MKHWLKILLSVLGVVVVSVILFFVGMMIADKSFKLEDKYYGEAKYIDLDKSKLDKLIKDKESFVVFVYQPMCAASSALEGVVTTTMNTYELSFYKISFSDMKETVLGGTVKYYPSVIIYEEGEIVDYLDANSGEDTKIYKKFENFIEWFTDYVKVGKPRTFETKEVEVNEDVKIDTLLEDVTYDENKVNIYFFWGDGCPHCEQQFKFFASIEETYGDLYELHTFEVWYNEDNLNLLSQFATKMGKKIDGIPFTIIGEDVYMGFDTPQQADMLESILTQHKNSYDVYFVN